MLEVEVKYRVADRDAVLAKLRALGAEDAGARVEEDQYLNAPDRDFKRSDEALRIRTVGRQTWLTYKGPKREAATKTRKELQVRLADGTASGARELFVALGYRPVAVVRKTRTLYHLGRGGQTVEVCLDHVDRVGTFVELEIVAEESRFEEAKAAVLSLAAELGLTDQERRSYLEMLLGSGEPLS